MSYKKEEIKKEKELLDNIDKSTNSVRFLVISFLLLSLLFRFVFSFPIVFQVFLIEALWLILSFPFKHLTKKAKTIAGINNIHFIWVGCELVLTTIIVHYIGGINWIGPLFYMFFPLYEVFLFGKKQRIAMFTLTIASYVSLVSLEYLGAIPVQNVVLSNIYAQRNSFLTTLLAESGMITFSFLAASIFRNSLEENFKKLSIAHEELKDIKDTLTVRVNASTKELKKLNLHLEKEVRKRSRELKTKLEELEKFRKLTVGRELKMIKLKERIEELEKNKK